MRILRKRSIATGSNRQIFILSLGGKKVEKISRSKVLRRRISGRLSSSPSQWTASFNSACMASHLPRPSTSHCSYLLDLPYKSVNRYNAKSNAGIRAKKLKRTDVGCQSGICQSWEGAELKCDFEIQWRCSLLL